jgi:hypothetical protein
MDIRELEARNRESAACAAGANNDLFSLKPKPALAFDGVFVDEARNASVLVDRHSQRIDLRTQRRMRAHVVDDLAHARKQQGIIQHRLADTDAVLTQLSSFADQPGCMGQSPHRNRSVIGCHAAELGAGHQHCVRAQVGSTDGGEYPCRSSANNDDVYHLWLLDDK